MKREKVLARLSAEFSILGYPMEEINPSIQGVRMARQPDGGYRLILVASNEMWADVLHHTLGNEVMLGYTYDRTDITFYLVIELSHIGKLFRVPVNANSGTLDWLNRLDERTVSGISVAYRDGKGGIIPFGAPLSVHG